MKNLNEEINKIKSLMLIKEQCGSDYEVCADDLRNQNYIVYSPDEQEANCETDDIMISLKNLATTDGLGEGNPVIRSSKDLSNCFVLLKSRTRATGDSSHRIYITFYNSKAAVITYQLSDKNDKDVLIWQGQYDENGSSISIGKLKFRGVWKNGKSKMEDKVVIGLDRDKMQTGTKKNICGEKDELYYKYVLSFVLNTDTMRNGMTYTNIKDLLN